MDAAADMASEPMDVGHASEEHGAMEGHGASEAHADVHDESFTFGGPAAAADADRTIDVDTVEQGGFHYEPGAITVTEGETVTFRVHNVGEAVHEFVLGDRQVQRSTRPRCVPWARRAA